MSSYIPPYPIFRFAQVIPGTAPHVPRGTKIVNIVVGKKKEIHSIHRDLTCASSKFFERVFVGPFAEAVKGEVQLLEEDPDTFKIFSDWLYAGEHYLPDFSATQTKDTLHKDVIWLKVFCMADRLMVSGLQLLAWNEIRGMFSDMSPAAPSRQFIELLFNEEAAVAMQMYIVDHIAFWIPQCSNSKMFTELFPVNERFGVEMATALIRGQKHVAASEFRHPWKELRFAEEHGLNITQLAEEARAADPDRVNVKCALPPTFATMLCMSNDAVRWI
jgi:hypothetical protein